MLSFISSLVVVFCFCVIVFCFLSAKKAAEATKIALINEAAAHRILIKLAKVHVMSDEHEGLNKAKALRELRVEVLRYADAIKAMKDNPESMQSDGVVSFALNRIKFLS